MSTTAELSAWWALVMGAAAALEDAANCLRDGDAKRAAEGAAKHYREKAKTLAPSLRHATKENGDCPHWCEACRVERSARAVAASPIDYSAAIAYCYKTLGHQQGTKGCIAFARGAEWMRDQLSKGR